MKESEKLRKEAEQTDNDLIALGKYNKSLRAKRKENFEETWLEKLQEQTEVIERDNGSYTFDSKYGMIDFFPKANKLLIRKENKWKKPGLRFIVKNIINATDFWVECNVCKQHLKNWTGSTPCCGSIAYIIEDGKTTTKISLFTSTKENEPIKPTVIDLKP